MAHTATLAYGRLEMEYTAYSKPHVARFWVNQFNADVGVGTFTASGTPASLDALATELTVVIGPLFSTGSGLAFGAWRGQLVTNTTTGSTIPIVEGTITAGTYALSSSANTPGAVSQITTTFRDGAGHICKSEFIGATYITSASLVYSSFGGPHKAYVDYLLNSNRIVGRAGTQFQAMIRMNFDTNDGLTRTYRR